MISKDYEIEYTREKSVVRTFVGEVVFGLSLEVLLLLLHLSHG